MRGRARQSGARRLQAAEARAGRRGANPAKVGGAEHVCGRLPAEGDGGLWRTGVGTEESGRVFRGESLRLKPAYRNP